MRLKKGVSLKGMQPQLMVGILAADWLCRESCMELVITSVTDGKHKVGSRHYDGCAFDMRTWSFKTEEAKKLFVETLQVRLNGERGNFAGEWDVVLEKTHIHVEWDPS